MNWCWPARKSWAEARSLLEQGYLESFLAGVGRTDLARFARLATAAPDRDRSLDDLLDKLPSDALQPPRLQVQPQEINLGSLQVGEDRRFMLHLENRGMRLLRGSVSCDGTPWLTLGDAGGSPEKLFQFTGELFMPVHVQGKRLRASSKQLEGHLAVESNGGVLVVTVRAEVPVKPYPEGVLQGAVTPRQVAEKAKAAPKGAAGHFEKGKVAQWYQDNGWIYPVQGPAASGLGAVQQFFEASGSHAAAEGRGQCPHRPPGRRRRRTLGVSSGGQNSGETARLRLRQQQSAVVAGGPSQSAGTHCHPPPGRAGGAGPTGR